MGDTGAGYSHSSCTPTPRIYKMGSSCFVTGCFLCFGLVSFYEILKRHQYRKNVRHLVISYIPFCMIVHQKSQQPNKTKKTPLKDVHGDTMHLLSILAGGLPFLKPSRCPALLRGQWQHQTRGWTRFETDKPVVGAGRIWWQVCHLPFTSFDFTDSAMH